LGKKSFFFFIQTTPAVRPLFASLREWQSVDLIEGMTGRKNPAYPFQPLKVLNKTPKN
jgi:hypothetical protein